MITKNRRLTGIIITATLLLLMPLIAMQFTGEVKWSFSDFIIAGVLLFGTGLLCEFIIRKVKKVEYRIAICAVVLTTLVLIWLELAVGIFGTPFAGS